MAVNYADTQVRVVKRDNPGKPENPKMARRDDGKFYAPSGASSRSKALDFTLMIWEAVAAIINRLQYGLDKGHDRDNWRKGQNDPIFIRERINHGMQHYQNLLSGVRPDGTRADWTDVEAALCNLAMLTWWRTHGDGMQTAFPWLHNGIIRDQDQDGPEVPFHNVGITPSFAEDRRPR